MVLYNGWFNLKGDEHDWIRADWNKTGNEITCGIFACTFECD